MVCCDSLEKPLLAELAPLRYLIMIAQVHPPLMTPAEYLVWEAEQPIKHEYINGEVYGLGGQTFAERELGWNRRTIRKGMSELASGEPIKDGYERSGRKRVEVKLVNLLQDIQAIVEPQSQADPSLRPPAPHERAGEGS